MTKDQHHVCIFQFSESYEVSNLLQKGALFEFLARKVAEKISLKSTGLHVIFRKIAILFGLRRYAANDKIFKLFFLTSL